MAIIKETKTAVTLPNGDKLTIALTTSGHVKLTLPKGYDLVSFNKKAFGADTNPVVYLQGRA